MFINPDAATGLKFEWDPRQNRSNLRKHGFDFSDAPAMFDGILVAAPNTREDYGKERWIGIGAIPGRVAVVAFAQLEPSTIRIISLRKANRNESRQYAKAIEDELEAR